ncbi:MAG: prolipoprotein diacylglyceryl transferase [Planctomycetota bacterium]
MRQTLFYLPHQLGPLPLFGWMSWSMIALFVYVAILAISMRGREKLGTILQESWLNWVLGAVILGWVLPAIEYRIGRGTENEWVVGLPVRGYGVFLMLGVVSAIAIGHRRTARLGIPRESFMALALYTVVGGLLGARIFYVVQKWDELDGNTVVGKLWTALQFTEGGLVVYGSILGGIVGIVGWTWRYRVKPLPLLDAIVPAFFIGLAFGRIGCLLNGCCYGGICDPGFPALEFPRGAPAYMDQFHSGRLLGMQTRSSSTGVETIESIEPGSWASEQGIRVGQQLDAVDASLLRETPESFVLASPELEGRLQIDRRGYRLHSSDFPPKSLPVHPAQIYASISAFLLCLWTCSIPNWNRRPGLVFGTGWIAYGLLRIMEEIIRVDEAGQFGTSLSIAQWISVLGIIAGTFFVVLGWRAIPSQASASVTTESN